MSKTILFTISNAAGTVYKFRMFKEKGYRVIGCDANPHAVGRHFADTFYVVPFQKESNYLDKLLEIVKAENVDIVVGGEGESLMLNKNRVRFEAENCTLVSTDSRTLETALDKCGLFDFLSENTDIPLAGYAAVNNLAEFDAALEKLKPSSVCIKPSRTSGSRGFVILNENPPTAREIFYKKAGFQEMTINEFRDVLERSNEIPKLLLMEYLDETNFDSNMVCKKGEVLFQSVKTREEAKVGTITKGEIITHPEIFEINKKIARALGTTGLIATQYIGNKLIEINPRWSTSMDYKSISEYLMGVQVFTGEEFNIQPEDVKTYLGLRMIRYWDVITYRI